MTCLFRCKRKKAALPIAAGTPSALIKTVPSEHSTTNQPVDKIAEGQENVKRTEKYGLFLLSPTSLSTVDATTSEQKRYPLDIIAVHGITGDAYGTWAHENRKLWLRDFLPAQFPGSRVFSFGYPADVFCSKGTGNIDTFARSLLEDLKREVLNSEESDRRIIFICHSMGGLVVKQALITAVIDHTDYGAINTATSAILFLATPHRGSSQTELPNVLLGIANIALSSVSRFTGSMRTDLINSLNKDSSGLKAISTNFRNQPQNIKIASFIEQEITPPAKTRIVDDISGILDIPGERILPMPGCDHRSVCRFESESSVGYKNIAGILREWAGDVEPPRPESHNDLLKLLSFPEMDARENKVDTAYKATYEWVRTSNDYVNWKTSPGGKLLIKGKAGCGKSTLMKHLFRKEESDKSKGIRSAVCGFFFHSRGAAMEKSISAMLRTILYQLLFQERTVYKALEPFHSDINEVRNSQVRNVVWTQETLMKMLDAAFQTPGLSCLVFIDALDEGENFLPADIFEFLEQQIAANATGSQRSIAFCLSSRPDNFINHRTNWMTIDLGSCNSEDIQTYVTSKLTMTAESCTGMGYHSVVPALVEEITRKADSVFLWVKLVVDDLMAAMNDYEDVDRIREILSDTPVGLWELFRSCLRKVKKEHHSETIRLLQIILVAERPLSIEELISIMGLDLSVASQALDDSHRSKKAIRTAEEMKIRILTWCRGLVDVIEKDRTIEITHSVKYHLSTEVQFMHQSVKDFLSETQLPLELDEAGSSSMKARGHELMLNCCTRYLQQSEMLRLSEREAPSPYSQNSEALQSFWKAVLDSHPLLLYSPFWIKHAELFAKVNPERDLQEHLQLANQVFKDWRLYPYKRYANNYDSLYSYVYPNMKAMSADDVYSSLLCFSAFQSLITLFKKLLFGSGLSINQSTLDLLLIAACDCSLDGSYRSGGKVGQRESRTEERAHRGFTLSEDAWRAKEQIVSLLIEKGANVNVQKRFGRFGSPLVAACWGGRASIVQALLDCGADVNTEVVDGSYASALVAASWGGSKAVIKLLMKHGAQIDMQLKAGNVGSALAEAALTGNTEMVKLLVDEGADVNLILEAAEFGSALTAAANDGKKDVVALLIDQGADVNLQARGLYGSALIAAAQEIWGRGSEIMELLIKAGADVNHISKTGIYGTALISAAAIDSETTDKVARVELLLDNGAEANVRLESGNYGSALIAAAAATPSSFYPDVYGHIMGLLIGKGADVNMEACTGYYGSALAAAASTYPFHFKYVKDSVMLLIKNGADVNAVLRVGEHNSALGVAIDAGGEEMAALLQEHKAIAMKSSEA